MSCTDLQEWSAEFEDLTGRISGLFVHPKSRAHVRQYLEGLLAPIERKNGWTIAEFVGEKEPKAMQRFLNLASWDADALRDIGRDYAMENLGDPRGVVIADPTGFAKKGKKSAGVQRQYSGTLGRIDNCQIGTFLAYVNSAGGRALIDRELYIPKESWFNDPYRCAEAGIPVDVEFATRPAQVAAIIDRAVAAVAVGGGDVVSSVEPEQVDHEVAERGEVLRCVVGSDLGGVLTSGHIADPVQAVLDRPLPADVGRQLCRCCLSVIEGGDEVDGLLGALLPRALAAAGDLGDLGGVREPRPPAPAQERPAVRRAGG
ncbi:transposase [Modestobacter sp. DSM 44400]|uniref:IS701 family transposase n=1 Tax=Modestobacter sp. DSM 44400 TaxID=1550230 RepID=UPI001C31D922|nr:transposase [Modestobacter sp. DSM 44400]